MTEELHQARDQLKELEHELEKRAEISKSLNTASLLLEKHYRELCRKNKLNDVLKVERPSEGEYKFQEFDPVPAKVYIKKKADPRLKNPIWRAM